MKRLRTLKSFQKFKTIIKKYWPLAHAKFACDWKPVAYYCTQVAASRMQIVPEWLPVACKLHPLGRQLHATCIKSTEICMLLAATQVQFATGGHSVTRQVHIIDHASDYSADVCVSSADSQVYE
jgi:hypothetical protein